MIERVVSEGPERFSGWGSVLAAALAIVVTVVVPRLLMLQVSVIDWDESIYALVAQQWIDGHVPYSTVFCHKPIGLYGIFALFFLVFGDTIWVIRVIPIVFVAGTAALLARLVQRQFGRDWLLSGLVAALYGLLTLANGGLATNTEILVNFFIVLAVYLLVSRQGDSHPTFFRSLAVGACFGMALQINYLAGILVLGVASLHFCWVAHHRPATEMLSRYFLDGAYMLSGLLVVSVLLLLPVLLFGDAADYFGLQLIYLNDYQRSISAGVAMRRISEAVIAWWPFYALAILLGYSALWPRWSSQHIWDYQESGRHRRILAWILMSIFSLMAVAASGRLYQHFFLLSVPSLVMLAGEFLQMARTTERLRNFCALWLLLMGGSSILDSHDEFLRGLRALEKVAHGAPPDTVAIAGQFMSERLKPGETIYVYDGQPILYFMTGTTPPTLFASPPSHLDEERASHFGSTPYENVREILESGPRFVVAGSRPDDSGLTAAAALLYDTLGRNYVRTSGQNGGAPARVYELIRNDAGVARPE